MQQGNWRKGLKHVEKKSGYSKAFHDGEFQNILHAISLGAYDGDRMDKLKYRFLGEEWKPIYNEMVRLGYFQEEDREILKLKLQDKHVAKISRNRFCFKNKKKK